MTPVPRRPGGEWILVLQRDISSRKFHLCAEEDM